MAKQHKGTAPPKSNTSAGQSTTTVPPTSADNSKSVAAPNDTTVPQIGDQLPAQTNPNNACEAPQGGVFDLAVGFVLKEKIEGGYVNDPRDPGGETNFGISKRSYPKLKIKNLSRDDAIAIYKQDYWDAAGCDEMPPQMAVAVFDCAVNQGVTVAKRLAQKAADVTVDGVIGPITLKAIHDADQDELVTLFLGWRLRRYAFTANAVTYMRGWSNRVLHLQRFIMTDLQVM